MEPNPDSDSALSPDHWWTPGAKSRPKKRFVKTADRVITYCDYDWNGVADWKEELTRQTFQVQEYIRIGETWTQVYPLKSDPSRTGRRAYNGQWYVFERAAWVRGHREKDGRVVPNLPGPVE